MASETATILVSVVDEATKTLNTIKKQLETMGTSAAIASAKSVSWFEKLNQSVAKVQGRLNSITQATSVLAVQQIASWAKALATGAVTFVQWGEEAARVEQAFGRVAISAGMVGDKMMETMMQTGDWKINDDDLKRLAVHLNEIGIRGQHVIDIVKYSKAIAENYGQDPIEVAKKLERALATGNTRTVAEYGIIVDKERELAKWSRETGKSIDLLTEAQERQIIQSAMMRQAHSEEIVKVEGLGSVYGRTALAVKDWFQGIAMWMSGQSAGVATRETVWTKWAEGSDDVIEKLKQMDEVGRESDAAIAAAYKRASDEIDRIEGEASLKRTGFNLAIGPAGDVVYKFVEWYKDGGGADAMAEAQADVLGAAAAIAAQKEALGASAQEMNDYLGVVKKLGPEQLLLNDSYVQIAEQLGRYSKKAGDTAAAIDGLGKYHSVFASLAKPFYEIQRALNDELQRETDIIAASQTTLFWYEQWKHRLVDLEKQQLGGSDEAKKLREQIASYEYATKDMKRLSDQIMGWKVPESLALAKEIVGGRTSDNMEQIRELAHLIDMSREAQEEYNKALREGDKDKIDDAYTHALALMGRVSRAIETLGGNSALARFHGERLIDVMFDMIDASRMASKYSDELGASILRLAGDAVDAAEGPLATFVSWWQRVTRPDEKGPPRGAGVATEASDISEEQLAIELQLLDAQAQGNKDLAIELAYRLELLEIATDKLPKNKEELAQAKALRTALQEQAELDRERTEAIQERMRMIAEENGAALQQIQLQRQQEAEDMARLAEAQDRGERQIIERNDRIWASWTRASEDAYVAFGEAMAVAWSGNEEVDQKYVARMKVMTDTSLIAIQTISQAMGQLSGNWYDSLGKLMGGLTSVLTALGVQAKTAAAIVGTITLAVAAIMAIMAYYGYGPGYAAAAQLGVMGAGLLALSAAKTVKSPSASTNMAVDTRGLAKEREGGGDINLTVNFQGSPLQTRSEVQDTIMESINAARYGRYRIPREMIA